MKYTLLRDISIYWAMFHVIFLFVIIFRSRYTKKKTILLATVGMSILMLLNASVFVAFGKEALGRIFFLRVRFLVLFSSIFFLKIEISASC